MSVREQAYGIRPRSRVASSDQEVGRQMLYDFARAFVARDVRYRACRIGEHPAWLRALMAQVVAGISWGVH